MSKILCSYSGKLSWNVKKKDQHMGTSFFSSEILLWLFFWDQIPKHRNGSRSKKQLRVVSQLVKMQETALSNQVHSYHTAYFSWTEKCLSRSVVSQTVCLVAFFSSFCSIAFASSYYLNSLLWSENVQKIEQQKFSIAIKCYSITYVCTWGWEMSLLMELRPWQRNEGRVKLFLGNFSSAWGWDDD